MHSKKALWQTNVMFFLSQLDVKPVLYKQREENILFIPHKTYVEVLCGHCALDSAHVREAFLNSPGHPVFSCFFPPRCLIRLHTVLSGLDQITASQPCPLSFRAR